MPSFGRWTEFEPIPRSARRERATSRTGNFQSLGFLIGSCIGFASAISTSWPSPTPAGGPATGQTAADRSGPSFRSAVRERAALRPHADLPAHGRSDAPYAARGSQDDIEKGGATRSWATGVIGRLADRLGEATDEAMQVKSLFPYCCPVESRIGAVTSETGSSRVPAARDNSIGLHIAHSPTSSRTLCTMAA